MCIRDRNNTLKDQLLISRENKETILSEKLWTRANSYFST
jgi:hypothetical protein